MGKWTRSEARQGATAVLRSVMMDLGREILDDTGATEDVQRARREDWELLDSELRRR